MAAAERVLMLAQTEHGIKINGVLDPDFVEFNGVGHDAYETFYLTRTPKKWSFCKTARRPYDIVVVAILCLFADILDGDVSSDGDQGDWEAGLTLACQVKRDCGMPLSIRGAD